MKAVLHAIGIILLFYLALFLVQDPEPPEIVFTSYELPPMQCPIQAGCDTLNP